MYTPTRTVFGSGRRGGHALVPEILEIGWGHFPTAYGGHLRRHAHEGAFELCLILSGEVEWAKESGGEVLRAGDVYVTQPGEMHWGRDDAMHPCTLYWLILGSPAHDYEWSGMDPQLALFLEGALRNIRTPKIHGSRHLQAAFRQVFDEHRNNKLSGDTMLLRRGSARAGLQSLMIELIRLYDQEVAAAPVHSTADSLPRPTLLTMEFLRRNPNDPQAPHRACARVGMDYRSLNSEFVEHLGTTLAQYWLRERIRLAREQLSQPDTTITEVAAQFGFSSSQHFATAFRKITGLTPSAYRRNLAQGCATAHLAPLLT